MPRKFCRNCSTKKGSYCPRLKRHVRKNQTAKIIGTHSESRNIAGIDQYVTIDDYCLN